MAPIICYSPRVFVFLSKLLPLLIYPLGLALFILVVALLWKRAARLLMIVAILLLLLAGNRFVSYAILRTLEYRYLPPAGAPRAGAIVVLGGGTRSADYPRPIVEVNEAGDRLLYAAQLYRQGAADHILVTGGAIEFLRPEGVEVEGTDMATFLEAMGVPEEAIWVEARSRNTYENALFSKEMLEQEGIGDILLVTSAMHMPRSLPLFEAQGLAVIPAPADYLVSQAEWEHLWSGGLEAQLINLLPNAEYLAYTTRALKEYIGIVIYSLQGRM